jgi:hypothetical protein
MNDDKRIKVRPSDHILSEAAKLRLGPDAPSPEQYARARHEALVEDDLLDAIDKHEASYALGERRALERLAADFVWTGILKGDPDDARRELTVADVLDYFERPTVDPSTHGFCWSDVRVRPRPGAQDERAESDERDRQRG